MNATTLKTIFPPLKNAKLGGLKHEGLEIGLGGAPLGNLFTAVSDADAQNIIQQAINELPETQRLAVVLRRYDDISYEEIGEILELTVPAVKSVLFRARTELREKLRKYLEA